jgi:hypothetical protein
VSEVVFKPKLVWEELVRRQLATRKVCYEIISSRLTPEDTIALVVDYLRGQEPITQDFVVTSRRCVPENLRGIAEDELRRQTEKLTIDELREIIAFATPSFASELWPILLAQKPSIDDLLFIFSVGYPEVKDTVTEELLRREKDLTLENAQRITNDAPVKFRCKVEEMLERKEDERQRKLLKQKTPEELIAILKSHN